MLKSGPLMMDPRWKSNIELAPNCPRCASTNTKFCYYNNYSLSQPRYFCKSCKRYWTKGGSLRNVPFGGGCRKTRRGKSNRFPTPGRISTTTGRSVSQPNSDFQEDDTLGNLDPTIKSTRTHGSDIDLAAVFSKFLNQDSSSDPGSEFPNEIDGSLDLLNSSNQDYAIEEQNVIECQGVLNPTQDAELIGRLPEVLFQPEFDPQFVGPDTNNYGLDEGFLSDGVGQDGLWSSDDFSWQASQLQGFEQDPNDHLTSYPDLLRSNWSSLNIPSYST